MVSDRMRRVREWAAMGLLALAVGWAGAWGHAKFAQLHNDYQDFVRMRAWVAAVQADLARQQQRSQSPAPSAPDAPR